MHGATIEGAVLDHVAHAVPRWQDVWTRYAVDLGAEWCSGGPGPGFSPGQVRFANHARVELLMPNNVEVNDFLQRFITSNGPGPHHLTFKVPDLASAIDRARRAGYEPIGIDVSDPEWLEAFIHPKQATGVVVQLAEAPHPWSSPPPDDYPSARRQRHDGAGPVAAATLRRVTHAVADLGEAAALFVELLGGRVAGRGDRRDHQWVDLDWGGPLAVRLVSPIDRSAPTALSAWLGHRSGRVHHLELEVEEPEEVPGAQPGTMETVGLDSESLSWVIPPEINAGMRLVLRPMNAGSV